MKKALAIIISLSLLIQCVMHLGIIGYYELHKDYIAKNLCENRNKPQLRCCGKCYLRKQLNKVSGDTGTPEGKTVKTEKNEVVYIIAEPFVMAAPALPVPAGVHCCFEEHLYSFVFPASIFHPPTAAGC